MKQTQFIFGVLALFACVFLVSSAAAADLTVSLTQIPSSVAHNAGQFTVRLSATYTGTEPSVSVSSDSAITLGTGSITLPPFTLTQNQTRVVDAVITFPSQQSGPIAGYIQLEGAGMSSNQAQFSVPIQQLRTVVLTKTREVTANQTGLFTVTNTGNSVISGLGFTVSGSLPITLSPSSVASLNPGETTTVSVVPGSGFDGRIFGDNSATITVSNSNVQSNSISFSSQQTFCKLGPRGGNLTLDRVRIKSSGDDDTTWNPLDVITVTVEFSNDGDARIKDLHVELGLFNDQGKNIIRDVDFTSTDDEDVKYGSLNDGDNDQVDFEFVVPADFDEADYKVAAKVYSDDIGEASECADEAGSGLDDDTFQTVSVERQSDEGKFMAFDNIDLTPTQARCGDTVTISGDVFNVGDQDEDQVKLNLESTPLNVRLTRELKGGLNSGDKESFSFSFTAPETLRDGTYDLSLTTDYDYNSRSGDYRQHSDDAYTVPLQLIGCSGTGTGGSTGGNGNAAAISANLGSDAVAGKELVVVGSITNLASTQQTFAVSASGYEDWATLKDISDRVVTLAPGESQDVTLRFDVDADASGEQTFSIEARSGDDVETQDVAVNFAGGSSSGSNGFSFSGNGLIWVIGAINVILVILIIVVAVRISRR